MVWPVKWHVVCCSPTPQPSPLNVVERASHTISSWNENLESAGWPGLIMKKVWYMLTAISHYKPFTLHCEVCYQRYHTTNLSLYTVKSATIDITLQISHFTLWSLLPEISHYKPLTLHCEVCYQRYHTTNLSLYTVKSATRDITLWSAHFSFVIYTLLYKWLQESG